jgi:L-ribulose-5-phosphate 3-epimerase/hexulose-6-phosphate isomerase
MDLKQNQIVIYEKAIPNQFDWEDKMIIAKKAGYQFIEMSVDESDIRLERLDWSQKQIDRLKDLIEKHQMPILSMCLSGHRRFPYGSHDSHKRKIAHQMMEKAILLSKQLGIQNIQLAGYDVYYEESSDETIQRFVDGLKDAAKLAEQHDIMLSIEIMDTYLCGTISRALEYVHKVDSKHLTIYPDLGNLTQWADSPEEELKLGFDYIQAIHLKDTKENTFKLVPFGDGDVRFNDLFNTLTELNYKKPFLVEMWADNEKTYTIDESVLEIKTARLWLEERM